MSAATTVEGLTVVEDHEPISRDVANDGRRIRRVDDHGGVVGSRLRRVHDPHPGGHGAPVLGRTRFAPCGVPARP
jgi:hypothetical protein